MKKSILNNINAPEIMSFKLNIIWVGSNRILFTALEDTGKNRLRNRKYYLNYYFKRFRDYSTKTDSKYHSLEPT